MTEFDDMPICNVGEVASIGKPGEGSVSVMMSPPQMGGEYAVMVGTGYYDFNGTFDVGGDVKTTTLSVNNLEDLYIEELSG